MEKITAKVDRQVTGLLDLTIWSNAVVLLFIVVVNAINLTRVALGQAALLTSASPSLVLLASFAIVVYLGYNSVSALFTKRRLNDVFVTLDDAGVSGVSLPNPTKSEQGEAFAIPFDQIDSVSITEIAFTRKHMAASIKIESAERVYFVPAPTGITELVRVIAEHMTAK